MRRLALAGLVACVAALIVAACGGAGVGCAVSSFQSVRAFAVK